jgi:hypothetical protein
MKASIFMKKKVLMLVRGVVGAAIAIVLTGCVPGETVVTISADDVGCVMSGGVGRAEVVSILTNAIPRIDLANASKGALKSWNLSETNTPLETVRKVFKGIEECFTAFLSPEERIRLSTKEEGTNIFVSAHITRKAVFIVDPKKLPAEQNKDFCLYIDEKEGLTFAKNPSEKQLEIIAGLLREYIHISFNSKELADCAVGIYWILGNPFMAKSTKIRIVGDATGRFKVEGRKIMQH